MLKKSKYRLMKMSRQKKYKDFLRLARLNPKSTILDVGVADKEFSPYDNYLEKSYPYPYQITALSIQDIDEFAKRYPKIRVVKYTGGRFPFSDKEFSVVHSNAVVEHVGDSEKQMEFITEMARCGQHFYFSTPAKEFLFEIHTNYPFIHWFPKPFFDFWIIKLGKG
jgi:SAM-dependent methyltransferase